MTEYEEMVEKAGDLLHNNLVAKVGTRLKRGYTDEEMEKWLGDAVKGLLNLKTEKCHLSVCKNEPKMPEIPRSFRDYDGYERCKEDILQAGFEQTVKRDTERR